MIRMGPHVLYFLDAHSMPSDASLHGGGGGGGLLPNPVIVTCNQSMHVRVLMDLLPRAHAHTHAHPTHTPLLPSSAVHCSTCLPLVCLWLSLQSLKGCPSSSQVSEVWGGPVVATILARLLRRPSVCRCTAIVATHTHTLTAPSLSSSFHHLCCAAAPVCVPTQ